MQALTSASGRGGDIRVNAAGTVRVEGSGVSFLTGLAAETFPGTAARGGDIFVKARDVELFDAGEITATTKGSGDAGSITVDARRLFMDGRDAAKPTLIQARVGASAEDLGASGKGGQVTVMAKEVDLRRGGVVTATTFGSGAGGSVNVTSDRVHIAGSKGAAFTGLFAGGVGIDGGLTGRGGDVTVHARDLRVTGPGAVSAVSTGGGDAGSVTVRALGRVSLADGGALAVSAPASRGGDVSVSTGEGLLLRRGLITAESGGRGGNIALASGGFISLRDSTMTAKAGGDGGRVSIDPPAVVLEGSTIDARAGGEPVVVRVEAAGFFKADSQILTDRPVDLPETDIAGALLALRAALANPGARLVPACGMTLGGNVSTFLTTGRGGQPPEPGGWTPDDGGPWELRLPR